MRLSQNMCDKQFTIQKKGDTQVWTYDRDEFEKLFGITYLQTLYFENTKLLDELKASCPWLLLHTVVGQEHRSLGSLLHKSLMNGKVADVAIRWIDDVLGYGLFARNFIAKETFIGQYTGVVRKVGCFNTKRNAAKLNGYCMQIPTRFWSFSRFLIDAKTAGNELRFANHSAEPSMRPFCLIDRSLVHIGFFAMRDIHPGEELTFHYGNDYWKRRICLTK